MSSDATLPLSELGGFRLLARLGAGPHAEVWSAEHLHVPGMTRAVAILRSRLASDPAFREAFLAEGQALEQLRHANLPEVDAIGEQQGRLYAVLELLSGTTLEALLAREGPLEVERALRLVAEGLDGVAHAHGQGLLHRELRPAALFLTTRGQVKVLGLGVARYGSLLAASPARLRRAPAYLAPELFQGRPASRVSDVYSLGITLYELLAGAPPFEADPGQSDQEAALSYAYQHVHAPLPDFRPRRPEVRDELWDVLQRATAKDPRQRIASASDLARALRAAAFAPSMGRTVVPDAPTPPPVEAPTLAPGAPAPRRSAPVRTAPGGDDTRTVLLEPPGVARTDPGAPRLAAADAPTPAPGRTQPARTPPGGRALPGTPTSAPAPPARTPPGGRPVLSGTTPPAPGKTPPHGAGEDQAAAAPTPPAAPPRRAAVTAPARGPAGPTSWGDGVFASPAAGPGADDDEPLLLPGGRRRWPRALAAALGVAVAGGAAWWLLAPAEVAAPPGAAEVVPDAGLPAGPPPGMAEVAGAAFTLGDDHLLPLDGPAHPVRVAGFFIEQREVSIAQARAFAAASPGREVPLPPEGVPGLEGKPATRFSHRLAESYCAWAHPGGRLPTEAEWELAARGPEGRPWPWGTAERAECLNAGQGEDAVLADVDGFPCGATPQGVLQLAGNVAEWTASPAAPYPASKAALPELFTAEPYFVVRGGSAADEAADARAARRMFQPEAGGPLLGFRCVLDAR